MYACLLAVSLQEGFNCPNNHTRCIPAFWLCDGEDDCDTALGDVGDETVEFCDSLNCRKNELRCPNEGEKGLATSTYQRVCDH